MVGLLWEAKLEPPLDAEFEKYAGEIALPLVRGRLGCSAVFVLRESSGTGRGILTFWISRKAMAVAAASPEWEEVRSGLARFGVDFDIGSARSFESTAHFLAGGTAP